MKIDLLKYFVCMFCKRIAPKEITFCSICYRFRGFTALPPDWNFWIESDFVFSSPKRVVCDECSKGCSNISEIDLRPQRKTGVSCSECSLEYINNPL